MFSPFEYYIIFEFGQFFHTLKSLRVHLGLIQWKQFNTIHCEEIKINMNVWLDITSEVFKGGRQIYIQMKAYVLPFKNIISFLNLANSYLKEPPCTLRTHSVETIQHYTL